MKRILIADSNKSSLVMTSEAFKDHFPGVQVVVASCAADVLEFIKEDGEVDAYILDFDLPDFNGAVAAAKVKRLASKPTLLTAFDTSDTVEAIEAELAAFDDCLSWIKKPINTGTLADVAKRFVEGRQRLQRRLECQLPAIIEFSVKKSESLKNLMETSSRKGKKIEGPSRLFLPTLITDCSHGGVKISCRFKDIDKYQESPLLSMICKNLVNGEELSIHTVATDAVLNQDSFNSWNKKYIQKKKSKLAVNMPSRLSGAEGMTLKGEVVWKSAQEDELHFGVTSTSVNLLKKLFVRVLKENETRDGKWDSVPAGVNKSAGSPI